MNREKVKLKEKKRKKKVFLKLKNNRVDQGLIDEGRFITSINNLLNLLDV